MGWQNFKHEARAKQTKEPKEDECEGTEVVNNDGWISTRGP